MTSQQEILELLTHLADREDIHLVTLFGSFASDHATVDSDIDVAIYPLNPLSSAAIQSLADQLAHDTGRSVDIVDLTHTNGSLLRQILRHGKVVFSKHSGTLGALTERLLDWQADFEPLRQAISTAQRHRFLAPTHGSSSRLGKSF